MVDREILAINKIAEYNKSITNKYDFFLSEPHYIISLTGSKQAIYTLYFCNPKIKNIKNNTILYRFVKNLSVDILESADKVISMNRPFPILINPDEDIRNTIKRNVSKVLTFGKYNGKTIDEIINSDIKYIYWLKDLLEKESSIVKVRNGYTYRLSHKQQELLDNIKDSLLLYYEELANENRKNIDSVYIAPGKYENIEFLVDKITKTDNYTKVKGHKGNIYYTIYWKPGFVEINGGDKIIIHKCKIKPYNEHLGIKYNYINYIKGITKK